MLYEFGSYDTDSEGNYLWPSAMNFCESLKTPNVKVQGGSNMTGTDLYVNKPHCAAAVRP